MLDINYIKENKEAVKKAIEQKKVKLDLEELLSVDSQRRGLISQVDSLRAERNQAAKDRNIEKGKSVKQHLDELEPKLKNLEKKFYDLMIFVPNVPHSDVPEGKDESENQVVRKWGEPKTFDFKVQDHMQLGKSLDLIDTEKASKISGTRFAYLKNQAVLLEFALIQYTFSILGNKNILEEIAKKANIDIDPKPFTPVLPPMMIKPDVYTKMARLDPLQAEERYYLQNDDTYLIGSAEHTLGPLHMDETLPESSFPIRYVGFSTSYRREAGSYGKDIQGIIRLHQFDKIEMESFTLPEDSLKEQDFIVAIQEHLIQGLNLPYQVVMICTGDMGGPDARQIDIETWMPGQNKYRETHTSDMMTDYQARRLNTKFKKPDGTTSFVHMNDATAFAIGRILVAILENNQQADGSITVPEALVPYTGFTTISPKE